MGYYSDSNRQVLLTETTIVSPHKLIDSRKRRLASFSPPEIYYIEYLETLASTSITLLLSISHRSSKKLLQLNSRTGSSGMGQVYIEIRKRVII